MAKPQKVTLKKSEQNLVLRKFKKVKDARRIAEETKLPRHQIMLFLEQKGLRSYSLGTYY